MEPWVNLALNRLVKKSKRNLIKEGAKLNWAILAPLLPFLTYFIVYMDISNMSIGRL